MLNSLLLMVFPVAMAFAAANDLFTMKIPNRISVVLVGCFFLAALAAGLSLETIGYHILTAAAVLAATFALFAFGKLGGGDAKLMATGALWMGPPLIILFLAHLAVFGGLLALLILFYRKFLPAHSLPLPGWAQRLHVSGTGIPYGIAIAASGLLHYPGTEIFRALTL